MNGLSSSLDSSSQAISVSGDPRPGALSCCGVRLESRWHSASAVQQFFLVRGMIGTRRHTPAEYRA